MLDTLFKPATALLARLSYAKKILLVATVVALPLGVVGIAYVNTEQTQVAFSEKETLGVRHLVPVTRLLTALVVARHQIARREAPDTAAIDDAVRAAADAQQGADLGTGDGWAAARQAITAAVGGGTEPATAVPAYNTAVDKVLALVTSISDNSNLTLDPDIDSYYVMDAVVFRAPILLDTPMRAIALALVDAPDARFAGPALMARMAAMAGKTETAVNDLEVGLGKAFVATADPRLRALRGDVSEAIVAHRKGLEYVNEATAAGAPFVLQPNLFSDATSLTGDLAAAMLPVLDGLLMTRISGLNGRARASGGAAGAGVILMLYLMIAFYRSATTQLTGMADALGKLADGDLTRRRPVITRDEVGRMATAFNHALDQLTDVMQGLDRSAGSVSRSAHELTSVNSELHIQAAGTAELATGVAAAAHGASQDVQSLSAGAAQMLAATQAIARSAAEAASVAASASESAAVTQQTVGGLGRSSAEIGDVVKVITTIAAQTNLLALNATIEAARAGDAGKGFAVVAGEVKDLAQETAKATDDIAQRVAALQHDSTAVATAIDEIVAVVRRIDDIQSSIAAAAEQQTATTNEMSRNVSDVAHVTSTIAGDVENVVAGTSQTTTSADATGRAAQDLSATAAELRAFVARFQLDKSRWA
jgi:methyl-accepting chemotaxis protein